MNKWIGVGRLTRDPEIRYIQGDNPMAIARYTLAVDRKFKREGEPTADFIPCVTFGKSAEFVEKYFKQGLRVAVAGRIQTGNYTNKEGVKVHTTEILVEDQEFAESKSEQAQNSGIAAAASSRTSENEFMNIPDNVDDSELPFN